MLYHTGTIALFTLDSRFVVHSPKQMLCWIFRTMFKRVNEAAFPCCSPVDKLGYRLTAFTVVLP